MESQTDGLGTWPPAKVDKTSLLEWGNIYYVEAGPTIRLFRFFFFLYSLGIRVCAPEAYIKYLPQFVLCGFFFN